MSSKPEVKCTIDTCEYWGKGNECHARIILVSFNGEKMESALHDAERPEQTMCATFEPKKSDD